MLDNSTVSVGAFEAALDPMAVIAIIGFVLAVIGTLQSGLFTYSAVVGIGKPDGTIPPPKEWGKPWPFSIATGLEGVKPNKSADPLKDPGGPFPIIHLFNDVGDYLGTQKDEQSYIGHNRALAIDVFPINVAEHESQYATYAILAARGKGSDPLCIVDFGLGLPNGLDKEGSRAFGAYTASSCGAPWYASGVHRRDANGTVPCFWLGGYGLQGLQVHLPSHTYRQTNRPFEELNESLESAHDWYCNHPAVLSLWAELPERHKVPELLFTDLEFRANRTLNETQEMHKKKDLERPGKPDPRSVQAMAQLPLHQDTITLEHEVEGTSASDLCGSGLSMGPDFVNLVEGKFCRMSDKTLWPTCDRLAHGGGVAGPADDCFDVESRQLVVGGKVTRSKPYSKEIHYPLD